MTIYANQTTFSFAGKAAYPTQVAVFEISGPAEPHPGLSKTLYRDIDYTVNWVNKTVTLLAPIVLGNSIRIDVYEVGNGDQLVRSSSDAVPIRTEDSTGFSEIYLDCHYTGDIQSGSAVINGDTGQVYTTPVVYANGLPLDLGSKVTIFSTQSGTNNIGCNIDSNITVGLPIRFSDTAFGGISSHATYWINSYSTLTGYMTISETLGGPVFSLTTETGSATAITNGYAIEEIPDSISARIILSEHYRNENSFLSFTILGESIPQRGYSLPETEIFTGSTATNYVLNNSVAGDNPENAIVEKNGQRLDFSAYTIDSILNELNLTTAPLTTDIIAVTSFNDTTGQYLSSVSHSSVTVAPIEAIENKITPPALTMRITNTTAGTNIVTTDTPVALIVNQTIIFQQAVGGTGFGNITVTGTVYFIKTVVSTTQFTISLSVGGPVFTLTTASGGMIATVGGVPAVRVQTATDHTLLTNDIVRLDGITGSVELNNKTFYARVITPRIFDLYSTPYDYVLGADNDPILYASTRVAGGYAWLDGNNVLQNVTVLSALATGDLFFCDPVGFDTLIKNTPIVFTSGTVFKLGDVMTSGIVLGKPYYIANIDSNAIAITISESYAGPTFVVLADDNTPVQIAQWEQTNADRLWVTINGYRVPSSAIRINPANYISLLTPISQADTVMMTSMVPRESPNEIIYVENIFNKGKNSSVYRANQQTRTWLTSPLTVNNDTIYMSDISRVVGRVDQTSTAIANVSNEIVVLLEADKRLITQVIVTNLTTQTTLAPSQYDVIIQDISPAVKIKTGVLSGHLVHITTYVGNLLYIAGEQIRFDHADIATNTVSGLSRGANGTARLPSIPNYTYVYGVMSVNRMTDILYSSVFAMPGTGPMQISNDPAAIFLQQDIL